MTDDQLTEIARALSAPTRVAILRRVAERSVCVEALAGELGVTASAVSQHLRRLTAVGLVTAERAGYYVHYRLRVEVLREMQAALDGLIATGGACGCASKCPGAAGGAGADEADPSAD
jgi:DNA-binding transcriptional ArsR family regulator